MSYLKSVARNKAYASKDASNRSKFEEYVGAIDVLAVSPQKGNNSEPHFWFFKESQLNSVAFRMFKKVLKNVANPHGGGWAYTFDGISKWHSITNDGECNVLTLGNCLMDPDMICLLNDREIVRTLTFKASLNGTNITKEEAIKNSEEWEQTTNDNILDAIPTCDDFTVENESSAGSSSGSSPATPAKAFVGGKRKARS